MKRWLLFFGTICFIGVFFLLSERNSLDNKKVIQTTTIAFPAEKRSVASATEKIASRDFQAILVQIDPTESQPAAELDAIEKTAAKFARIYPKEFEEFFLGTVKTIELLPLRQSFFLVNMFMKHASDVGPALNLLLKRSTNEPLPNDPHVETKEDKLNLVKTYALDQFKPSPANLRDSETVLQRLISTAKNAADLSVVSSAGGAIKRLVSNSNLYLREILAARQPEDRPSLSDLIPRGE